MDTVYLMKTNKLIGVSTVDFHITARCSQACPYCWGPRRFRHHVDAESAQRIITRIKELGVRRIVFTGGDPLQHPGHFAAIKQSLAWLRSFPGIDVKVCTPVTRHNLSDIPAIAQLVEAYSHTTQARVFYNVFQAFPRAMFSVKWENLVVTDEEFASLSRQIGTGNNIRTNFLDHDTLDRLYVMVFPDGSMIIPRGADYLNFGPSLNVIDFEYALNASQFDSAKHLRHSHGWNKEANSMGQVLNAAHFGPVKFTDRAKL